MATILVSGKEHIRDAKIPQFSRHRQIYTNNKHSLRTRLLVNKYLGFSRTGIAPLGEKSEPYDLIHCLNDVALTHKPWIVTFEDILPRTFGHGGRKLAKLVRYKLTQNNCHKIIGQSQYALKKLVKANTGWDQLPKLLEKTQVVYPSINIKSIPPKRNIHKSISLVFVGNQFARKGGISAVRLAELALGKGLPITVHIVSNLHLGTYTDFTDDERYKSDLQLLDLPNIVFHGQMDNSKVMELLQQCDFQYMPTIGDTFGYSIVEGFSVGTPAIVTNTCAMPELVHHDQNGYLLNVDVNEENDIKWLRPAHDVAYRSTEEYWERLDNTYRTLAEQALVILECFMQNRQDYERLSSAAINQVEKHHDARAMSRTYDFIYDAAIGS